MASWKYACCAVWAFLVGCSVTANLCVMAALNGRSSRPTLHAYWASNLGVLLGGVLLIPRSVLAAAPCRRPSRWWSMLGGVFTLPLFLCIPASSVLGVQVVLLVQLTASLGTALVFDLRRGSVQLFDWQRIGGFGVVVLAVMVENLGGGIGGSGTGFSVQNSLLLLAVAVSGVGVSLQAKCNSRLVRDLGSAARSTIFSGAVNLVAGIPVGITVAAGFGVTPCVSPRDWPLWLFAGCQSAFYMASLSQLPKQLGYTTSYLLLLMGKLASSSVADTIGLSGKVVPFDLVRGLTLALVLAGTALFSRGASNREQPEVVRADSVVAVGEDSAAAALTAKLLPPPASQSLPASPVFCQSSWLVPKFLRAWQEAAVACTFALPLLLGKEKEEKVHGVCAAPPRPRVWPQAFLDIASPQLPR